MRAALVQGAYRSAGAGAGSVTGVVLVRDLQTGVDTRLSTIAPTSTWGDVGLPTWSPDGLRVIHRTGRVEGATLVDRRADIAGPVQEGANRPRFTRDGSRLFLIRSAASAHGEPQGQLVRVPIATSPRISIGPPEVVLHDRADGPRIGSYDVAPDGRRFLMYKPVAPRADEDQRLVLVQQSVAAVRR